MSLLNNLKKSISPRSKLSVPVTEAPVTPLVLSIIKYRIYYFLAKKVWIVYFRYKLPSTYCTGFCLYSFDTCTSRACFDRVRQLLQRQYVKAGEQRIPSIAEQGGFSNTT